MRFRPIAALFTVLLVGVLATTVQADQYQVFLKLTDANGSPVTDLQQDEVTVLEDGAERKTVELDLIDWPTKLSLLVDNGPATTQSLIELRNGLRGLLEALPEGMEVSLYTLNPQPRRIVRATTNLQEVIEGVDLIAPDQGAPRFLEGLQEAVERIDEDDSEHFPVIVMVGTDGPEGSRVRERDINELQQRLIDNRVQLNVAMLSLGGTRSNAASGQVQVEVGISFTKMTGGRYENINVMTRMATLLPEFGRQIAEDHERRRQQYLITYERPDGVGDPTKGVSANLTRRGGRAVLSFNGHVPDR